MKTRRMSAMILVPLAAGLAGLTACDDPTEVEDHLDVEGIAIYEAGIEIYRYMLTDGNPDPLALTVGTHDVTVQLLDGAGLPLPEEGEHEEEHVLDVDIEDPSILTWTPEAHTHTGDVVEFHGELNALQAGSTLLRMCVPHEGHCDFEVGDFEAGTEGIPVTVSGG